MPVPVPQLQQFSIQPGLSAYVAGNQMRTQREDRQRQLEREAEAAIMRAADLADTPEKWNTFITTIQGQFPDADLSEFADFSSREAAIAQSMDPYQRAQLDLSRRGLALQEQAFAADQARAAAAAAAPRGFEDTEVNGVLGQRNRATGQFEPFPEWMQPGGGGQEIDFGNEQQLRGSFNQLTANYRTLADAYGRIRTSAQQGTAPGDMSLIFSYMKMLDPTSTVREGEYASAQNTTGIGGAIINLYNQAVDGTMLNPTQRQEFVNTAGKLFGVAQNAYNTTADYYRGLATQYGMDPNRIVPPTGSPVVSADGPSGLAANPGAPRSPQAPTAPRPLTTPVPTPTPPSNSTGRIVRPPELTQQNILDTVRGERSRGNTFEQAIAGLAERYGVTVEQMMRWIEEGTP